MHLLNRGRNLAPFPDGCGHLTDSTFHLPSHRGGLKRGMQKARSLTGKSGPRRRRCCPRAMQMRVPPTRSRFASSSPLGWDDGGALCNRQLPTQCDPQALISAHVGKRRGQNTCGAKMVLFCRSSVSPIKELHHRSQIQIGLQE